MASDYEQSHNLGHIIMGIVVLCTVGLLLVQFGGDFILKFQRSSSERMSVAKENMEEVCTQGFKDLANKKESDYDQFQDQVDQYARNHGLVNSEMFFMMCGQFAGKLAQELFDQRIDG